MERPGYELFTSLRYDPALLSLPANVESWPVPAPPAAPYYMLPLHLARLLEAARHFGWGRAVDVLDGPHALANLWRELDAQVDTHAATPLGLKVVVDHGGAIRVETRSAPAVAIESLFPRRLPPPRGAAAAPPTVSSRTGGALMAGDEGVSGDAKRVEPALDVRVDSSRTAPSDYTSYKTTRRAMYNDARERAMASAEVGREVLLVSETDGAIMEGSVTSIFFWRDGRWVTPATASGGQTGTTRRWALEHG